MLTIENILFLLLAYMIGAFPSAVWLGRIFYSTDVREYGSGNAGATNTFRVLGAKAGTPVLLLDILKGWIAVNLFYFVTDNQLIPEESSFELKLAFGIAAVTGHLFPLYTAPIKRGVLQISEEGEIIYIHKKRSNLFSEKLEIFEESLLLD